MLAPLIRSRILWLGALTCVLTACPHRPAVVGETQLPTKPKFEPQKSTEADDALQKAIQTAETGSKQQGIEAYLAVRKAYPETTAGQEALYRAGVIYFESGDYVNARKKFNELLFENPLFDKAQDAKLKLGQSALEVGAYRDAYQTLSTTAEHLEGPERIRALDAAIRAAEGAQLYAEALRIAVRLADEAKTPEDQKVATDRVTELVEGKVPFLDIAKVLQDTPTTNPAWPILQFKLARIYYHLRDFTRLTEALQTFLREAPQSPFAPQAQELLARASRSTQVKPKTLGVVLPMTGKYKPLGEAVMRGVGLALQGSDIQVVVKDSQGDVQLAGQAVEDLAFDEGAIAVLGPLLTDDSKRAALVAEELQVPILTLTRQEGITEIGPHVFRNMLTNSAQAAALAKYSVDELGYKKFAILYPEIPYGEELMQEFWDDVVAQGGEVRGAEGYEHDATTFTDPVKKLVGRYYLQDRTEFMDKRKELKAQNLDPFHEKKALEKLVSTLDPVVDFDALFIPDDWRRVGLVTPALAVEDIITNACEPKDLEKIKKTTGKKEVKTVTLLGSNQWESPKGRTGVPELLERGGKFVLCSIYVDGFFVDSNRPATKKFVGAYRDAYKDTPNKDPGLLEATGYDSAMMIRKVLEGGSKSREQFRDALANVRNFDGATGKTSFNDEREAQKPLFFLTIEANGVRELNPDQKPPKVGG